MNELSAYWSSLRTSDTCFNISYAVMMLMMALLPFTTFFMWPIGIVLMVLWVCPWNWREKWENFKQNNGIPYGFFLLGICLIPILGFTNSANKAVAWSVFECHLWFFFAPVVFLTTSPNLWSKRHIITLLTLFSASEVALLLFFLIRGIIKMTVTGDPWYMYNDIFCHPYHHAYVALYATFVYILIFYYLTENNQRITTKRKTLLYAIELLLTLCVFFLYSRAGILVFLILHLIWCGYAIYRKPSRWKPIFAITVFVFALFALLIVTSPTNRFSVSNMTYHQNNDNDTNPRLIIWQAAWKGMVENLPWGVGTGDGNEVIMDNYHKNGHWLDDNHPYNAHNQFLSSLLTNGIPGIIILLFFFSAPLGLAIRNKDLFMFSLFLMMFLNCLVECMFDRRAGVDFIAVMIPLLMLKNNS